MKKQHENSKQQNGVMASGVSKRENDTSAEMVTKKCPHCGETLPEKIAFCLYCMKPLIGDSVQSSEARPQGNGGSRLEKKSAKMLIGVAAIIAVIAIVAATSVITVFILSRQGIGTPNYPQNTTPTMPPNTSTDSAFNPEQIPNPEPIPVQPPEQHPPEPNPAPPNNQQVASNITIPDNIIPAPPARAGGPENPSISAQRAVELARYHLIFIGVSHARFEYVYMDMERGTWVWSVEFDGHGRSYEFYVDVSTGDFLKAPGETVSGNIAQPTPSPSPVPSPTGGSGNRPSGPAISMERAIEIAYADIAARGINASFRSDSGMSWERGQWVWELLFSTQGERMPLIEFYINVDDGSIVKFEWDD